MLKRLLVLLGFLGAALLASDARAQSRYYFGQYGYGQPRFLGASTYVGNGTTVFQGNGYGVIGQRVGRSTYYYGPVSRIGNMPAGYLPPGTQLGYDPYRSMWVPESRNTLRSFGGVGVSGTDPYHSMFGGY